MNKKRFLCLAAMIMAIVPVFVSCTEPDEPNDAEIYIRLSVSDVSDGKFTINFECGDNTSEIEYAIGRAVNMKKDSVLFANGTLDGILHATPVDGKFSTVCDYSSPLDFGPYTVYAKAISKSGRKSSCVKQQVCALTTGVTIEYLSRTSYIIKPVYNGDEYIVGLFRGSKTAILRQYGSINNFVNYMKNGDYDFSNKAEEGREYFRCFVDAIDENSTYKDAQYFGFATSDGTKVTGAYCIEMPLQDYDPNIPLPKGVEVTYDYENSYRGGSGNEPYDYFKGYADMDENTEWYFHTGFIGLNTAEDFWRFMDELKQSYTYFDTVEELAKWYLTSGLFYRDASMFFRQDMELEVIYHAVSNGDEQWFANGMRITCPVNWNGECGPVGFHEYKVPDGWLDGYKPVTGRIPFAPSQTPLKNVVTEYIVD